MAESGTDCGAGGDLHVIQIRHEELLDDAYTQSSTPSHEEAERGSGTTIFSNDPSTSSSSSFQQTTSDREKDDLGPFCKAVGITVEQVQSNSGFQTVQSIKNGLVLELYDYLVVKHNFQVMYLAKILITLCSFVNVNERNMCTYIRRLLGQRKQLRGIKKHKVEKMQEFLQETFHVIRKRQLKDPDTPRKKKLRTTLEDTKVELKEVKKEASSIKKSLIEEENTRKKFEHDNMTLISTVQALSEEISTLETDLKYLEEKYNNILKEMQEINTRFHPMEDDLHEYSTRYKHAKEKLEKIEKSYYSIKQRLAKVDTRNVNRRLKRKDEKIQKLQKKCSMIEQLEREREEFRNELEDEKQKLAEAERQLAALSEDVLENKEKGKKRTKQVWYLKKRASSPGSSLPSTTSPELKMQQERILHLQQKVLDLEHLLELLQDEKITTFEGGKYTNEVRETIMELLSLNVSMSKVTKVIQTVVNKMAKKDLDRLPSLGSISQFALEARHLADIEVAKSMLEKNPLSSLGNCIHGDGTTKYHKKYQNFEVTLPDGTQKTFAMMEMGRGDTDAVMQAFERRMHELADAIGTVNDGDRDIIYKDLVTSIRSTMTDQGPTMPQFSERLKTIRCTLLPEVVKNWNSLSPEVQKTASEFGSFFCKMHPLINFAEEINKTLKAYEEICTSGKSTPTNSLGEAGVFRLVRTASKAFHHRGSDKSGVEDSFTSYLENEYGAKNHLVHFVGNRANIIFEGAAALYFHLDHVINFVGMLPDPNLLLTAVKGDASEIVYRAELKALGIFCKLVTDPLWQLIKTAENILDMNSSLHVIQMKLQELKIDARPLLQGEPLIPDVSLNKDILFECLFNDKSDKDADFEVLCIQALELICCATLLILERQCKDQLPGGRYWNPSEEISNLFKNVPSTNMVGERDFAQLDLLVRKMPSARVTTLEALVMWSNNGTSAWLDGLAAEEKEKFMKSARSQSKEILEKYHARATEIKAQKWAALQEKQQKRKEREEKQIQSTVSLTAEVTSLGGLWTSSEMVNIHCEEIAKNSSEENVRRAIYSQLQFLQKIVKCHGPAKEHYQLSAKNVSFTANEMKSHLIEVLAENKIAQRNVSRELEDANENSVMTNTPVMDDERLSSFLDQKGKMFKKLEAARHKRAAESSKVHLESLLEDPASLVGRQIQHLFTVGNEKQWYVGRVTAIHKQNLAQPVRTIFRIDYEEEEEDEFYPLLSDLKKGELIIL